MGNNLIKIIILKFNFSQQISLESAIFKTFLLCFKEILFMHMVY
ncbi:unnamed protein product, partial [Larinioides sclopetarius]